MIEVGSRVMLNGKDTAIRAIETHQEHNDRSWK